MWASTRSSCAPCGRAAAEESRQQRPHRRRARGGRGLSLLARCDSSPDPGHAFAGRKKPVLARAIAHSTPLAGEPAQHSPTAAALRRWHVAFWPTPRPCKRDPTPSAPRSHAARRCCTDAPKHVCRRRCWYFPICAATTKPAGAVYRMPPVPNSSFGEHPTERSSAFLSRQVRVLRQCGFRIKGGRALQLERELQACF